MAQQTFTNQKLDFVEELVLYTDSHIFLTGRAGTGKTTFLKNLPLKTYKRMAVVAPTGVAALNAGGQTIHSFFQLPFGPQLPENALGKGYNAKSLAAQYQKLNKKKINLIRSLDLLIIDEISMVRADVLDAIDAVLRRLRRSQKPFGGLQLLMIGDVHQLAPVAKAEEWEILSPYYDTPYFFGSQVLKKAPYVCVELEHIYRQHDEDFITLLNKVRDNRMDAECVRLLNSRFMPNFVPKDREGYITLTTHNYQADQINESKLEAIKEKSLIFNAEVHGTFPENTYPTKEELELKVGAQVMFVKNDPNPEKAYYNGKIGMLVGYDEKEGTVTVESEGERITVPKVKWENMEYTINAENQDIEEREIGSFTQIPLRLAWAVTIHKSQGLTFDKVIVDAGQAFAHGQVYVALSRCTSLEGLVLKTRITSNALVNDYSVNQFVEMLPEKEPTQEKVDQLRHDYELETILELIDFDGIYKDFGRLMKVVYDNDTLFEGAMIQDLSQRRNKIHEELCSVGIKFEGQIRKLHDQAPSCEHNPALQERLIKGVAYFDEHLKAIAKGLFDLPFKTDNQAVNEQLTEALKLLKEDIYLKGCCLEACKDGFTVREYQKTKSVKAIEAEKSGKKKVEIKFEPSKNGSLYSILLSWRAARAEADDVPPSNIAPIRTLKAIASEKPVTLSELRTIEGMGTKRIRNFGAEILDIVLRSMGKDSEAAHFEKMPAEFEKKEKKQKGETYLVTKTMFDNGMSIEDIAKERGLAIATIHGHLAHLVRQGALEASQVVEKEKYNEILDYFESTFDPSLGAAKDVLGDNYEYWEIRMVLAELEREHFFVNPPNMED
ncbi:MAG: helix-turn-helix domain-containing protein [Bacteroidales bacterium]|nr:helix-turn-helix domain-containing protein [Bacteroidales bacterium]